MFIMNCMKLNQNMNYNDIIINYNELYVQFICKVIMLKKVMSYILIRFCYYLMLCVYDEFIEYYMNYYD